MMKTSFPSSPASPSSAVSRTSNGDSHHVKTTTNAVAPTGAAASQEGVDSSSSLNAAASLIRTLDTEIVKMSFLSATAAKDAEDARRNAREASEVARRYTARSYPNAFGDSNPPSPQRTHSHDEAVGESSSSPLDMSNHNKKVPNGGENDKDAVPGGRKNPRKHDKIQSSYERLAQSHAEDVLSLSLELERSKQALEHERLHHDETRSSLTEARSRHAQLNTEISTLETKLESQRQEHEENIASLREELQRARTRVEAAEEDAQLALDLAKGNADSREQLEIWLQRALQEVEVLRQELVNPSHRHRPPLPPPSNGDEKKKKQVVRFAESPTVVTVPPRNEEYSKQNGNEESSPPPSPRCQAAPRSMVAAGRRLLQRAIASDNDGYNTNVTTDEKVYTIIMTPAQSAQRRSQLKQRLLALEGDHDHYQGLDHDIVSTPVSRQSNKNESPSSAALTRLLHQSGQRMGLMNGALTTRLKTTDFLDAETMAKQFCNSVEAKLSKQQKDIQELQSLCEYLENKLALSEDGTSSRSEG